MGQRYFMAYHIHLLADRIQNKFLPKGVLLTGLLAVASVAQSAPVFINPSFNDTPVGETITGSGTFTGGGWEVTSGTLYVSYGVFGSPPLPHHLEFGNDAVLPAPNSAASVKQTLAGTSTAPGATYDISFDWNRDFGFDINGNRDFGNLTVTFGSTVIGSFDPFANSPGTFTASGLLASGASTDFSLDFSSPLFDNNLGNTDRIYVSNFAITETVVPVPAAVWLFGSGLLGLIGMARRKKS
jgi:hypothetical protein